MLSNHPSGRLLSLIDAVCRPRILMWNKQLPSIIRFQDGLIFRYQFAKVMKRTRPSNRCEQLGIGTA
jgi:hypothetical protein